MDRREVNFRVDTREVTNYAESHNRRQIYCYSWFQSTIDGYELVSIAETEGKIYQLSWIMKTMELEKQM